MSENLTWIITMEQTELINLYAVYRKLALRTKLRLFLEATLYKASKKRIRRMLMFTNWSSIPVLNLETTTQYGKLKAVIARARSSRRLGAAVNSRLWFFSGANFFRGKIFWPDTVVVASWKEGAKGSSNRGARITIFWCTVFQREKEKSFYIIQITRIFNSKVVLLCVFSVSSLAPLSSRSISPVCTQDRRPCRSQELFFVF